MTENADPHLCLQIRLYEPRDLPQVRALHDRMQPFRPEDQAEVQAMVTRAAEAERSQDRWVPLPESTDRLDAIETSCLAFWVVEAPEEHELVATVGVWRCNKDTAELAGLPQGPEWRENGNVAELKRLRVAPEHQRQGLGARLTRTVINWSRARGFRSLVLNTTAAQGPALALYRKLGFREVGRSYVGPYELVWLELPL